MIRIHAAAYSGRSREPLFPAAPNARLRRCLQHPDRQLLLRMMAWLGSWVLRRSLETSLHLLYALLGAFSNNLRVAKLTKCRSILLWMTANFLRRNYATACRSQMRKA